VTASVYYAVTSLTLLQIPLTNMPSNSANGQATKESLLSLVHHFLGDIIKTSLV